MGYVAGLHLPDRVAVVSQLNADVDVIQFFVTSLYELDMHFPHLMHHVKKDGCMWISWPTKESGFDSDLNESVIRQVGNKNDCMDAQISIIDDTWLGMKFLAPAR
ncbi:MAG: hypothetical protein JWM56_1040 [Candidatus Peribacteria bacterium]|nr:hypothetical protein [Candidatus Peribacteria bacterium]